MEWSISLFRCSWSHRLQEIGFFKSRSWSDHLGECVALCGVLQILMTCAFILALLGRSSEDCFTNVSDWDQILSTRRVKITTSLVLVILQLQLSKRLDVVWKPRMHQTLLVSLNFCSIIFCRRLMLYDQKHLNRCLLLFVDLPGTLIQLEGPFHLIHSLHHHHRHAFFFMVFNPVFNPLIPWTSVIVVMRSIRSMFTVSFKNPKERLSSSFVLGTVESDSSTTLDFSWINLRVGLSLRIRSPNVSVVLMKPWGMLFLEYVKSSTLGSGFGSSKRTHVLFQEFLIQSGLLAWAQGRVSRPTLLFSIDPAWKKEEASVPFSVRSE
ncbi:hypothetical protein Tco_0497544 [Tanacetum coccineum]